MKSNPPKIATQYMVGGGSIAVNILQWSRLNLPNYELYRFFRLSGKRELIPSWLQMLIPESNERASDECICKAIYRSMTDAHEIRARNECDDQNE